MPGLVANRTRCGVIDYGVVSAHVCCRIEVSSDFVVRDCYDGADAKKAEAAGADVIIAQGMEAGEHRGAFDATKAEQRLVGLIALVPAIVDAMRILVVAA